ncbi:MAG: hypothetical protein ACFB6S_14140 [Geminicoccaceae bacterium]
MALISYGVATVATIKGVIFGAAVTSACMMACHRRSNRREH